MYIVLNFLKYCTEAFFFGINRFVDPKYMEIEPTFIEINYVC